MSPFRSGQAEGGKKTYPSWGQPQGGKESFPQKGTLFDGWLYQSLITSQAATSAAKSFPRF